MMLVFCYSLNCDKSSQPVQRLPPIFFLIKFFTKTKAHHLHAYIECISSACLLELDGWAHFEVPFIVSCIELFHLKYRRVGKHILFIVIGTVIFFQNQLYIEAKNLHTS